MLVPKGWKELPGELQDALEMLFESEEAEEAGIEAGVEWSVFHWRDVLMIRWAPRGARARVFHLNVYEEVR